MEYLKQINKKEIRINQVDSNNHLNIIISGDFSPINGIEVLCKNKSYNEIFGDTLPTLKEKDLSIINLETPLTTKLNPIKKTGPNLAASPTCIESIKYGGFDIATLSNNHILDHGESGLMDTINTCVDAGIETVGVGKNIEKAQKPLYFDIKGNRIAVLNFAEHEFSIAGPDKAGANPLNPITNYYQILQAKKNANVVLVIVHGGNEYYPLPSPRIVETCRFFADLGVTAIIGHHPHCASGFEIYNGVPIFYSLGNFIFDLERKPESFYEGYFIKLTITDSSICNISIFPYYQCKDKTGLRIMSREEEIKFLRKIEGYSRIIINPKLLMENWIKFCDSKKLYYLSNLLSFNKLEKQLFKRKIFSKFLLKDKNLFLLLNLVRCEAHRETIVEVLKSIVDSRETS